MAQGKKAVVVYADWKDKFEILSDEEAGKLIKHFFRYVNDENPQAPDRTTELLFIDIKASLKRDLEKWEHVKSERSKAGKASAEARKKLAEQMSTNPTNVDFVPTNPTVSVNDSDSVSVTVSVNEKEKSKEERKKKTFSPPTLEEVKLFFLENKQTEQKAVKAFMFYSDGDWKDSNGRQVQNWKQKMRAVWFEDEKPAEDKKYHCEYQNAFGKHWLYHTESEILEHTKSGYTKLKQKL